MKTFLDLLSLTFSILGVGFLLYLIYGEVKSRIQGKVDNTKDLLLYVLLALILINGMAPKLEGFF